MISAPKINEPILGGSGQIYGSFTTETANNLAILLRAGALPAPLHVIEERTVGAELGADSVKAGRYSALAGLVLVRQRPGTASGVVFVTLEDEFGIANLVVWPTVFDTYRRVVMGARMLGVRGRIQCEGEKQYRVIHLVAEEIWDLSAELDSISELDLFHLTHPRGDEVRSDPGDRRVKVAEANATRHRSSRTVPAKPTAKPDYDRSRIVLDRPKIRIQSRDFH